jgi:serine/threonine protein kinase
VTDITDTDVPDEDDNSGDSGWPSQGSLDGAQHESQNQNGSSHPSGGANGSASDNSFYGSHGSGYQEYSKGCPPDNSDRFASKAKPQEYSTFGLEGLDFPFTSVRNLGCGGHGLVDEVVSASSKETFARKSVVRRHTELSTSSRMIHLKNELSILRQLSHPNLVKLVGAYTDEEHSHIIMTPVADQNLADFMRTPDQNRPHFFMEWISNLNSALAYLHEKEVKHLDIKPQNILVKGVRVLLADFGTAKSFFNEHTKHSQEMAVTPMFCAPETAKYGRQDYSADIFSLGCVFSEMITRHLGLSLRDFENFRSEDGNRAFHLTLTETRVWIQQLKKAALAPRVSNCPEQLCSNIYSMLEEEPSCRPRAQDLYILFSGLNNPIHSCKTLDKDSANSTIPDAEISITSFNSLQLETLIESAETPQKPLSTIPSTPRIELASQPSAEKSFKAHPEQPGRLETDFERKGAVCGVKSDPSLLVDLSLSSDHPTSHRFRSDREHSELGEEHPERAQTQSRVQRQEGEEHETPDAKQDNLDDIPDHDTDRHSIDPIRRACSVAVSDKVPSLSSGAS